MLDILSDYLKEVTTPELRDSLEEAHAAFDRIELPNYEQDFEALLMLDGENDVGNTLQYIVALTHENLTKLLRQHEIIATIDASIDVKTAMLNGLLDLQDYDNYQDILNVTSMDVNPQEAFAELLTLVSTYDVEDLLVNIEEVNFVLIKRIHEMALARDLPPASEEEQAELRAYIEKLQRFLGWAMNPQLTIVRMIKDGMDVGFPFLTYLGLLGRELEELPVERAAYELMAMALVSSDGTNNPQGVIKEHLENYISDVNKLTKIDIKLSEISLGLQR